MQAKAGIAEGRVLQSLFRHSGIGHRYSVLPDFGGLTSGDGINRKTVEERMAIYKAEALSIGLDLVSKFDDLQKVTHLVWVSCTGLSAPGMELSLKAKCGFGPDVETTAFNFLGCHGFFHALKYAGLVARSNPENLVMVVCVELCTLHFQENTCSDQWLANTIFGDGGAAVLVTALQPQTPSLEVELQKSYLFSGDEHAMGWDIGSHGFNMVLSQDLPAKVGGIIYDSVCNLLANRTTPDDAIRFWLCHPGGSKILDYIGKALALSGSDIRWSYQVLHEVGNVSSASILYVMEAFLESTDYQNEDEGVLLGLGPGLSLESALVRLKK